MKGPPLVLVVNKIFRHTSNNVRIMISQNLNWVSWFTFKTFLPSCSKQACWSKQAAATAFFTVYKLSIKKSYSPTVHLEQNCHSDFLT